MNKPKPPRKTIEEIRKNLYEDLFGLAILGTAYRGGKLTAEHYMKAIKCTSELLAIHEDDVRELNKGK